MIAQALLSRCAAVYKDSVRLCLMHIYGGGSSKSTLIGKITLKMLVLHEAPEDAGQLVAEVATQANL